MPMPQREKTKREKVAGLSVAGGNACGGIFDGTYGGVKFAQPRPMHPIKCLVILSPFTLYFSEPEQWQPNASYRCRIKDCAIPAGEINFSNEKEEDKS